MWKNNSLLVLYPFQPKNNFASCALLDSKKCLCIFLDLIHPVYTYSKPDLKCMSHEQLNSRHLLCSRCRDYSVPNDLRKQIVFRLEYNEIVQHTNALGI